MKSRIFIGAIALLLVPFSVAQTLEDSEEVDDLGVMRYNGGTPDNGRDDVFVLDVNDDNEIGPRDIVLATDGFANTVPGQALTGHNSALFGKGKLVDARIVYADFPEENGAYSAGDWVFITGAGEKLVSTTGDEDQYSIRLTDTDSGERGTILITGHDDLRTFRDKVDDDLGGGSRDASFTFVDKDGDGTLDVDEDAYITPDSVRDGDPIPAGSILIRYADPPETNVAPEATLTATPAEGPAALEVTFTLDATDANDDVLTWSFDADDGTEAVTGEGASATITHNYTHVGVYNATITVDDGKATAEDTIVITVTEPPAAEEPPPDDQENESTEPDEPDNAIPGFAPIGALVGLAIWARRRS